MDTAPSPSATRDGYLPSPYSPPPDGVYRDWSGRRYRVGPAAVELAGCGRSRLLGLAAAALAAVGVLQYGYGAALPAVAAAHGWQPGAALLPFAVWALVQAVCAAPAARLRASGLLPPRAAVPLGALLSALALITLGSAPGLGWAVLGYGVVGGVGAGLVYHSCVHLAAAWYPERPTWHTAFTGGAFALGTVPVAVAAPTALDPGSLPAACAVLAGVVAAVGVACGRRLHAPPPDWWPPETDPRRWALRPRSGPAACRDHSPTEAWRSGALPALHIVVAGAGAAALFDLAALPSLLAGSGFTPVAVAAAMGALVAASGLGRIAAGHWGEYGDRRRVLSATLACGAVAHLGMIGAVAAGSSGALVLFAVPAGLGAGACYPLTRALAEDFFGVRGSARIHGLVYSAKGAGGLLGVGAAAALVAWGPGAGDAAVIGLAAAGATAALAAGTAARLRRPVLTRTIPRTRATAPPHGSLP
ncbi:MFS transporter [Nocardiopsis chromatogenes]|uniref:MFS transporter n=1 Tax=Nocardiopsis chromatogenes TaxID=280239 RepID=UPI000347E11E|nr:MFS transporter [Nocardiopsis chromatogenes]